MEKLSSDNPSKLTKKHTLRICNKKFCCKRTIFILANYPNVHSGKGNRGKVCDQPGYPVYFSLNQQTVCLFVCVRHKMHFLKVFFCRPVFLGMFFFFPIFFLKTKDFFDPLKKGNEFPGNIFQNLFF